MMKPAKTVLLVVTGLICVAVLLFGAFFAMFYFSMVRTVMKKPSPDRRHTAKLVRVQGIDVNFKVTVDGRKVFASSDFAPVRADFREQLIWDTNSHAVILEVAGKRVFGYHAVEKRALTTAELLNVQFAPFEVLRFEGTLPERLERGSFNFITTNTTVQDVAAKLGPWSQVRGSGILYYQYDLQDGSAVLLAPESPFDPSNRILGVTFHKDANAISLAPSRE